MHQEAWTVYHERRHVRRAVARFVTAPSLDASAVPAPGLPAPSTKADVANASSSSSNAKEEQEDASERFYPLPPAVPEGGAGQDWPPVHAEVEDTRKNLYVSADLPVYHSLLDVCIDTGDADLGRSLLRDMSSQRPLMRGDEGTYQRMIALVTTRFDDAAIDEAMDWLEEAKARGLKPTNQSYRLLWRRCWKSGDKRADAIRKEWEERQFADAIKEDVQKREISL